MLYPIIKRLAFIFWSGFLFSVLLSCTESTDENILEQALDSGEPLLFINYDKAFAGRFSLQKSAAIPLSEHLHAIAVEFNRINNRYDCTLHLYIDDDAALYTPAGGGYFSSKPLAEYFFVKEYGPEDQTWNSEQLDKNLMRILFRSKSLDDSGQGLASTLQYNRVRKGFLPGLSLYSLETECLLFEKQNFPADIFIQKAEAKDKIGNQDPRGTAFRENSHAFTIPMPLIENMQPYISIATEHNFRAQ